MPGVASRGQDGAEKGVGESFKQIKAILIKLVS